MVSCKEKNSALKMIRGKQIEINQDLAQDPDFIHDIAPYQQELQNKISEVLCFNPKTLSRDDSELESSLGNFYADACYAVADSIFFEQTEKHPDFALFNYGGIRTSIPKGIVTVDHIFKLMPFENKLVIVQLSGESVSGLFEYLEKKKEAHPVAGLTLEMRQDHLTSIQIQGKDFDKNKEYLVVTHDYLQKGGDSMEFFQDPIAVYPIPYKVRDVFIDRLRVLDTLRASLDGRFIKIE